MPNARTDKESEEARSKQEVEERFKNCELDGMGMGEACDDFQEVKNKHRPSSKTTKENKEAEDEVDEEANDEKQIKKNARSH